MPWRLEAKHATYSAGADRIELEVGTLECVTAEFVRYVMEYVSNDNGTLLRLAIEWVDSAYASDDDADDSKDGLVGESPVH